MPPTVRSAAELAGDVPSIQGTLALQTLDISPYVEAYRAELATEGPWSEATIRLPGLSMANVDVRLSAEQLLVGSWRTGRVAIAAAMKEGQFTLNVGDARPYGGALAATAKGGMQDGAVRRKSRREGDRHGRGRSPSGSGRGERPGGDRDVQPQPGGPRATWREVAGGLKGTGKLAITDASLGGFDAGRIAERLRGEDSSAETGDAGPSRNFKATANLTIADGAVSTADLHANGPGFEMDLSAETSLASGVLSGAGALTLPVRPLLRRWDLSSAEPGTTRNSIPISAGSSDEAPVRATPDGSSQARLPAPG